MAMNFDDAIGGYVTEISEKINETRDEFILESLMPYAQTVESRINKQELERAIRMFYGRENLAEVVRCKDCNLYITEACPCTMYEDGDLISLLDGNDYCSRGERRKDDAEIH